jgi:hypothetical protein
VQGLAAHIVQETGADADDFDQVAGALRVAEAAVDYLGGTTKGFPGPPGGLLWVIFSAVWEGMLPQADIDGFFGGVRLDLAKMLVAWKQAGISGPATVALIPGDLTAADIQDILAALWRQRGSPEPGEPPGD